MRRFHLGVAAIALPVLAFSLFLAGCSKEEKKADSSSSSNASTQDPTKTAGPTKVLESKGGVIKGKITLKGSPDLAGLTKALQEKIAAKTDNKDYCMSGSETEKTQQQYRISDNKLLGNVFVWIKPEAGTFFKVSDKQLSELKGSKVKIRQPHCAFIPHCAFLFSKYHSDPAKPSTLEKTGQVLEVANDAQISHNTNWSGGTLNKGDNVTLPSKGNRLVDNLVPSPAPVAITCNIHTWMDAHLWVVDTPYYAISYSDTLDGKDKVEKGDAKFGTYEIKNLPVGKVRVFAWHEAGEHWLNKGEGKGEVIEIAEGKETTKDFEAEAK
jgi:hypothetical protein